ncbi:MAG TPA: hypothetical protein VN637_04230, partial [Roseiarcus sp.]|nr:hypothetical protein [Roseiarcus sp.]
APRRRPYAYILVAVLGCSLPYVVVQPTLRYRYMISSILIFCALDGAFRLIAHIRPNVPGKADGRVGKNLTTSEIPTTISNRRKKLGAPSGKEKS